MKSHQPASEEKLVSTQKNRTTKLKDIRNDSLSITNPYHLSTAEQKDLKIVLNTLDYINENSKNLSKRQGSQRTTFFISHDDTQYAPIHLNNYPSGKHGEKQMIDALIDTFILSFETVKKAHAAYVKQFCGHLNGNCIDARTRGAFDYALTLGKMPTFTDCMQTISDKKAKDKNGWTWTYFDYFHEIYETFWEKPYDKDKSIHGYCKQAGVFDETSFSLISEFLISLGLKMSNSFLLKPERANITLYRFVIFHKNLLNSIGLREKVVLLGDAKKSDNDDALQNLYDAFATTMDLDFDSFSDAIFEDIINLLNRCDHYAFFRTLSDFDYLCKIKIENRAITLLNLYIKRLELCQLTNPELIPLALNNFEHSDSILHIAVGKKDLLAVEKLIRLGADTFSMNSKKLTPITIAAHNKSWDIVSRFAELKPNMKDEETHDKSQYGIALEVALQNKKIDLAYTLLNANATVLISSAKTALELNDIKLCSSLFKRLFTTYRYIDDRTCPIKKFIKNNKIHNDTLSWLLDQKEISAYLNKMQYIATAIHHGDLERIQLLLSKTSLNIADADQELTKIDALPNAAEIRALFNNTSIKIRLAENKIAFHNDYDGAIQITSSLYHDHKESNFDLPGMLKFNDLNPGQVKIVSGRFLQRNFDLMQRKKDSALFKKLETYLGNEAPKYLTDKMRAAFAESKFENKSELLFFPKPADKKRYEHPENSRNDETEETLSKRQKL